MDIPYALSCASSTASGTLLCMSGTMMSPGCSSASLSKASSTATSTSCPSCPSQAAQAAPASSSTSMASSLSSKTCALVCVDEHTGLCGEARLAAAPYPL